jgi:putative photosynthetic complex assembly protein
MNDPIPSRPFPRAPLLGAGALVGVSLLLAAISRLTGFGAVPVETATPVEARELRFEDRSDGAVAVLEPDGDVIEILPPGTNGFVRGVMRGLARERRMEGVDAAPPFRLVRWDDGRLSLTDTATGREIQLVSFGPTQVEVFAKMLHAKEESR